MILQKYEKKRSFSKNDSHNILEVVGVTHQDDFQFLSFAKKGYIWHNSIQRIIMKKTLFTIKGLFIVFPAIFVIYSCSASTGSRYSKEEKINSTSDTKENNEITDKTEPIEDFDITPFKTRITIPEKKLNLISNNQNVWFDYGSNIIETKTKSLVGTDDGFRVIVLTSDNLEEANQVKADVYFSLSTYEVYIDFEPPFYKVKVGDFDTLKPADELRFRLSQLGYKESKVIKDKINIYK
jgi:hypothetical protein